LRSSLRCFFFAIRLRRFLMTEPTRPPLLYMLTYGHAHAHTRRTASSRAHVNVTGYPGRAGSCHPG
jgi:hypothetical protein